MQVPQLGALYHPFFAWEGSPTKTDCREKGTLVLTSPMEELVGRHGRVHADGRFWRFSASESCAREVFGVPFFWLMLHQLE